MCSSEERRNRLLRRADWRFLTSAPQPGLSALYASGTLGEAVRAVSRQVVDGRREAPDGACDLAVALDPDATTLRSSWSALRPGGSCYTEWTSRLADGPALVRRRLAAAGFVDVTLYTPRPSPECGMPEAWMPLGVSSAARWYLARHRSPDATRQALATAARRLAWQAARWLPVVTPLCAIARKPVRNGGTDGGPEETASDFQAELTRAVQEQRRGVDLRHWHGKVPWVVLTPGARAINKVVLLALAPDGRAEFVVKLPRTSAAAAAIAREAAVLEQVRDIRHDAPGIPRVLFSGLHAGLQVVGETAVHGVPVSLLARRLDYPLIAMKAAEWQASLVHPGGARPQGDWWHRLIEPVLAYLDGPLAAIVDPGSIHATRTALEGLGALPMACEQRDFSPWNVLVTPRGELAVLDWESAEPCGLPALDLIYFLTYFAVYREAAWSPDRLREVHQATLDPTTDVGRMTRECLRQYAKLTGMDLRALRSLRVLCWLVHARSEYVRTLESTGTAPAPPALRDSVFVALWRQELESAWSAAA